ncbi:hypothetical protein IR148_00630 [Dysgonomonas mossii]|uniref:HK97 gp10 family phage protein n=1 Tax=Dysgonomonas mossii TaxID=163665 RepID=A0A4Y9IPT2_9BACT|nr:HK97 gp10 family phage protein [Dysgonomonas mossii]MBF0759547.1 hypothetical protein [Dysgonomonas mossii]TFU90513.1 hypothetical protein E4T88_00625 [Dysgonomonas mossii]
MIEVKVIDREAITYLVNGLEDFEKDKAIKDGLKAGGNVIQSGGKRRLRSAMKKPGGVTGNLLRSFHVRPKRFKLGVLVGFRRSNKNMVIGGGNHAHLVDMGTGKRYWKTRGRKYVGVMPANRFWSDTESQDGNQAINEVYSGVERAVDKIKNRR